MLLSSMEDHWTFVPTSLLRELEINIQTVKENLLRKQDLLTKVIEKQQILINKQATTIEKYERNVQLQDTEATSSRSSDYRITSSSLHDSALDISSDGMKEEDKAGDDTDSYITLSDSSVITSVNDYSDQNNDFKTDGVGHNPIFMEIYENKSKEITNVSDVKNSSHKLEKRREKFVSTTNIVVPRPENITQIIIGDPESKRHKARQGVLQKSVRLFRKSKSTPDSFFKSKSEGNIKELVDNESKPSLLQSYKGSLLQIYKGFTSLNLRSPDRRVPCMEAPGFLSLREEVSNLDDNQRMICKLSQPGSSSLPPVMSDSSCAEGFQSSLFSCFTAGSKPMMPNHRNVLRPRDIKERLCLSPLLSHFNSPDWLSPGLLAM